MREAGKQAKAAWGNLQLCAGLEANIEGATHAVGQQRLESSRERRREEKARISGEEEEDESVAEGVQNISIATAGMEEEVSEGLGTALGMDIEEEGKG